MDGSRRWIAAILGVALVGALIVAGLQVLSPPDHPSCVPASPGDAVACTTIDGFPIGAYATECGPGLCDPSEALAEAGLAVRNPGHAAILSVRNYDLDLVRACGGGPHPCVAWPGHDVWVFDLADGTRRAVGVQCVGIAPCRAWPDFASPSQ